jgi:hypothetical protein
MPVKGSGFCSASSLVVMTMRPPPACHQRQKRFVNAVYAHEIDVHDRVHARLGYFGKRVHHVDARNVDHGVKPVCYAGNLLICRFDACAFAQVEPDRHDVRIRLLLADIGAENAAARVRQPLRRGPAKASRAACDEYLPHRPPPFT